MKTKFWLPAICTVLLCASALSCGESAPSGPASEPVPDETGSQTEPETEPATSPASPVYDIPEPELPELDFGGADFRMVRFAYVPEYPDLWTDGLTGEVVNDAVFNRNLKIEEKFHIRMIQDPEASKGDTAVATLILAGDDRFSMVEDSTSAIGDSLSLGPYLDLTTLPYCDFEQIYWSTSMRAGSEVHGKLFAMGTDLTWQALARADFIYFNKRIAGEYDLPSPYRLVEENRWTIEQYLQLIRAVSKDLDGDGVMTERDLWGAIYHIGRRYGTFMQLYVGCGLHFTRTDENGGRVVDLDLEKAQELADRVKEVMNRDSVCALDTDTLYNSDRFWGTDQLLLFSGGHALFAHETMEQMKVFREMEDDFGVVPNPKWDSDQESYYHRASNGGVIAVPSNVRDPEMTGAVLEYGSWLSHYTVLPAYYEVTIKQKRTRDEDAIKMLDIIHDSIVYDFGDMYDPINMAFYVWNSYEAGSFPRVIGTMTKKIQKSIDKMASAMDRIGS
ncbi:MAG: hypothetical protein II719_01185 [Clostridia bacterium]|nr:hypothetical protein [Clostridia bacterium]